MNVIIIGKIYGTAPEVGYYTSSDKCLSLVKMGSSPIADSLYPYMLNHKNYRLIKRLLGFVMPIITVGVIIIGIYAEPICEFVLEMDMLNQEQFFAYFFLRPGLYCPHMLLHFRS